MSTTRFAIAASAALFLATSVSAQSPTIGFIDNGDSSVTLQITPDAAFLPGSVATELAFAVSASPGLALTGASIVDTVTFDTPNPGDSPFIPGSPIGGDAFGLDLSGLSSNQIFAAFGSNLITTPGPRDFLRIEFSGVGTIDAFGVVAQAGVLVGGLTASIAVVPEPTTATLSLLPLAALAARRRKR